MVISATFSKPSKTCEEKLGRPYLRVKIKLNASSAAKKYEVELFTEKQSFHQQLSEAELDLFIEENAGKTFKNAVIRSESEIITILANKKGEITKLVQKNKTETIKFGQNKKNYIIPEGSPVPFLVYLGVMQDTGKVISSKFDKFRQINRFLEFVNDVLPVLEKQVFENGKQIRPVRIADFGCGKSYLTFAVHYFLTAVKNLKVSIVGLDLKKDVIDFCNRTAEYLKCEGLYFDYGNIAEYDYKDSPDMVVTLHACDTATDFALDYAVKKNCSVILSVPCCQHEINGQLDDNLKGWKKEDKIPGEFASLLKYGLIKERFASLLTDSIRCEFLENRGYSVQVLEFIDMEGTPKNLLIRAVKNGSLGEKTQKAREEAESVIEKLNLNPMIKGLIGK